MKKISSCLILLIYLTTIIQCANFDPRQNALANALQNILSPANTEKAMQIIQMAANRQMGNPGPCVEEKKLVPMGIFPRSAPPNAGQYVVRQRPSNIPIQGNSMPEMIPMNPAPVYNPARPKVATTTMPIIVMPSREVPQMNIVQEVVPQMNSFMPAASSISTWAPPPSSLTPPPAMSHPRGHFLRKIPIPPPTL